MKQIKIIIFLCLLTLTSIINAQITVTGKVLDINNQPIEFANVIILNKDNGNVVLGTITDEKGNFTIKTDEKRKSNLQISFVGFEDYSKIINSTVDLGKIILKANNELEEVVITARKKIFERRGDKIVFNIQNTQLNKGNNGIEVLKRAPNIYIDGKENILLRNEAVTILINGRKITLSGEDMASYIKNIDAGNIKRIEIQNNASAELDASIQGGVINFILKKNKTGFSTNFKTYYTQQGNYPVCFTSTNFNYGKQKWNLYGSLSYKRSEDSGKVESSTVFKNINRLYINNSNFTDNSKRFTANIGVTIEPWKRQELGLDFYTSLREYSINFNSAFNIFVDNELIDIGNTESPTNKDIDYYNTSVNYTIKLDTIGGKIKFIGDYALQNYKSNFLANTFYEQNTFNNNIERSSTNTSTNIFSAQIDFIKDIKPLGKLSLGIKTNVTDRENIVLAENFIDGIFVNNEQRTSLFNFKENIYATYITMDKKLLKNIYFKVGFRIENTNIDGLNLIDNGSVSQNYTDYFPSFFLSKELKSNQSISVSYNRKIDRPPFKVLNPYTIKINDFNFQIGNPNIQPQYRNDFEINYNFKKHSFSAYYNYTKDAIIGKYFQKDDIIYYQSQNVGSNRIIGVEYNFSNKIKKWWFFKVNSIYNNQYYLLSEQKVRDNYFLININNDYIIAKTWSMNLSANYSTPGTSGNFIFANNFSSNFMIQKTFLNNNLKLRFYADDIFDTLRDKNRGVFSDFDYNFFQKRNTQSFTIWALFTIDSKNKVKNQKNKSSNDTKKRL